MNLQRILLSLASLVLLSLMPVSAQEVVELAPQLALNRATKKVTPAYPPVAQQLKLKGQLDVEIVISAEGDVEDAKVAKGNAIFSQNALSAVKQWKFQPLLKDGKPVKMSTTIAFNFAN